MCVCYCAQCQLAFIKVCVDASNLTSIDLFFRGSSHDLMTMMMMVVLFLFMTVMLICNMAGYDSIGLFINGLVS